MSGKVVVSGFVVLTFVVLGLGVWQVQQRRDLTERADLRAAAMATASAQVRGLTTLSPGDVAPSLKQLQKQQTGNFLRQFRGMFDTFATVVTESQVTTIGTVVDAGVVRADSRRAVVLVAVTAKVSSDKGDHPPVDRHYRFRVALERHSGHWLVADMDFVALGGERWHSWRGSPYSSSRRPPWVCCPGATTPSGFVPTGWMTLSHEVAVRSRTC
jgi:Mce-associated membrane protein